MLVVREDLYEPTSFCTFPDMGIIMPKLQELTLSCYVDDIETHALERMPCLSLLGLAGPAWKASASHDWVYHLPAAIEKMDVSPTMTYGTWGTRRQLGFCTVAPCLTTLSNLKALFFWRVSALRPPEWQEPFPQHFTGLTEIALIDCQLQAVPACVMGLSTLKVLDVSGNPLQGLTVGPYLSSLMRLRVCSCEITVFPLESISRATSLQELDLQGNNIEWTEAAREAVKNIQVVIEG
jgi:hypothetical protein